VDWILLILLFLHVAGAVVAFGATFAFPFIGNMAGNEPQHVNFALRVQEHISKRWVFPLALLQGVTGLLLVFRIADISDVSFIDVLSRGWLLVAIVLYAAALSIAFFVLVPTGAKLIEATSTPPPPPPPGVATPSGPPPHIVALVARGRMFGMINAVIILVIVFLMVTKPF